MGISYGSTIKVNNEVAQVYTPIQVQVTYGQSNRFITIDDTIQLSQEPNKTGKVLGISKESLYIKWDGFGETSIIPIDIAKLMIKFVKQNLRTFKIIITDGEDKNTWYHKKQGNIYTASMYQTMFDVEESDVGDYGCIMLNHAHIIDTSKPLSFNPALFFLGMDNSQNGDAIAINNKGIMISKNYEGTLFKLKPNGSSEEPLVITDEIQKSTWYMTKNII